MSSQSRFDVSDPVVTVRILCGLLFVPHVVFKLNGFEGAVAFFSKAGIEPALPFVVLAILAESICAIGLIFNIAVKWTGLVAAFVMAVATKAVLATKGAIWLWNFGGVEYNVFWGILCAVLAIHAWREERRIHGRFHLLSPGLRQV